MWRASRPSWARTTWCPRSSTTSVSTSSTAGSSSATSTRLMRSPWHCLRRDPDLDSDVEPPSLARRISGSHLHRPELAVDLSDAPLGPRLQQVVHRTRKRSARGRGKMRGEQHVAPFASEPTQQSLVEFGPPLSRLETLVQQIHAVHHHPPRVHRPSPEKDLLRDLVRLESHRRGRPHRERRAQREIHSQRASAREK